MAKTVSVIIPTYNRTEVLMNSIKTVLNQTYKGEIELIIVDDSEKSLKQEIDKGFKKNLGKNRKINYIHNAKREGAPKARNLGIQKAKGEYIAFLDDDDLWIPKKIEKQVEILDKNKDVALVICYSLDKRFGNERINKPPESITHEMVLKSFNLSSTSSYLIRKNILKEIGSFDISLPSAQEYDLAIRISKNHQVYCVPEMLMIQNATEGQISENWNRKIKGLMAIYQKHRHDYNSVSIIDSIKSHIKFVGMLS
ncbi:glycosyltransferase family 2 protein, partial [Candidatus Babeliales bacterium]|nr:glycosyltransferase family 2 protein [Candidatus Babeliales bacterium]